MDASCLGIALGLGSTTGLHCAERHVHNGGYRGKPATASESEVGKLTEEDQHLIAEVQQAYEGLAPIPCTQCEYCLPCPSGVAIPRVFSIYNDSATYDSWSSGKWAYKFQMKPESRADNCIECGECEAVCPQNIEIIDWLAIAHEKLTDGVK